MFLTVVVAAMSLFCTPRLCLADSQELIKNGTFQGTTSDWVTTGNFLERSEVIPIAAIDQHLLDLIDQYASTYYRSTWNMNIEEFKAWIATIAWGEGGNGGYGAHSQGKPGTDLFAHKDCPSFTFSTGIGPFQLDRGGYDGWGTWPTEKKLDAAAAVQTVMEQHYTQFPNAGATLQTFANTSKWNAVQPGNVEARWSQVTGTAWSQYSGGNVSLSWSTIETSLAGRANDPSLYPYAQNVQDIGMKTWNIGASASLYTDSGKTIIITGSHETWHVTARNGAGTKLFQYYYTYYNYDASTKIEVWVYDNAAASQNALCYIFERECNGPCPERYLTNPGDTLSSPALDVGSDTTPPTISAFSVSSTSIIVGDSVTVSYTASDTGGSGLKTAALWRTPDDGYGVPNPSAWQQVGSSIDISAHGNGPFQGTFPSDAPPLVGKWWYGVHINDGASPSNWNDERNSQTGGVPGVFGPIQVTVVATPTRIIRLGGDLAFGNVTVGQSAQRTMTVYNDGNSTLSVTSISCPTCFNASPQSFTVSASGSHHDVTVTFSPTAAQLYTGTITVVSDKTSGTNTISFSGTGTASPQTPTVATQAASAITWISATLNAHISNTGGATITEERFSWGSTPSCSDGSTDAVMSTGNDFSYTLTGLTPNRTYYFQASADNSAGWGYGSPLSFTTVDYSTLSINDVSMMEGDSGYTNLIFTVSLTGVTDHSITFDVATADGTATALGGDYWTVTGSGLFAANPGGGTVTCTFPVRINGDTTVESDERFYMDLTTSSGVTIAKGRGVGTIQNDDIALGIAATDAAKAEGNSGTTPFTFAVSRSGLTTGTTTVNYTVTGSGTNPADASDFGGTLPSGQVIFAAGQTSQTLTIYVSGDLTVEADNGFTVTLSGASGNAQIITPTATGTIQNDDVAGTLALSSSTYSVDENAGTVTVTVNRSGGLASGVGVNYATSNGTATAGSDYTATSGTLTFNGGETSKTFTVPITNDSLVEGNERFNVALSSPTGGGSVGTPSSAIITIVDDDVTLTIESENPSSGVAIDVYLEGVYQESPSTTFQRTYNTGASVTLVAPDTASGNDFLNWTEGGTQVSTSASYTFTLNGNRTLVANFTQTPQPAITNPSPGSTLTSSSVTFQWSSGAGVSEYFLYVGTSLGANDIYGQSQGLSLSATVNNLPVDGSTLYVRLWWDTSAGWQYTDYTYTAFTQITYALTVQSTPISGISITGTPADATDYTSQREDNSRVSLTAPPIKTVSGKPWYFVRWTLNGALKSVGARTLTFNITIDSTAVAQYKSVNGVYIYGPSSIYSLSTAQYTYKATFTDGSSAWVTASATWSDNTSYLKFISAGNLYAYSVPYTLTRTIYASYGGVKVAKNVTIRNR